MTRRLKVESCGFHVKVAQGLSYSMISVTAIFEEIPLIRGSNYGGVTSRCYISEMVRDRS